MHREAEKRRRTLLIGGIRAFTIEIYQSDMEILVSHPRRYGKDRTDSVDNRTSLAVLSRNAGAWPISGLREMVSASVRLYLDHQEKVLMKEALRKIYQISKDYDVDLAIRAFELAITQDGQSPLADAAILVLTGYRKVVLIWHPMIDFYQKEVRCDRKCKTS